MARATRGLLRCFGARYPLRASLTGQRRRTSFYIPTPFIARPIMSLWAATLATDGLPLRRSCVP